MESRQELRYSFGALIWLILTGGLVVARCKWLEFRGSCEPGSNLFYVGVKRDYIFTYRYACVGSLFWSYYASYEEFRPWGMCFLGK